LPFSTQTELTILLGDIFNVAAKACGIALLLGWFSGAAALLIRWLLKTRKDAGWQRFDWLNDRRPVCDFRERYCCG